MDQSKIIPSVNAALVEAFQKNIPFTDRSTRFVRMGEYKLTQRMMEDRIASMRQKR